jgi:hypothetical protein
MAKMSNGKIQMTNRNWEHLLVLVPRASPLSFWPASGNWEPGTWMMTNEKAQMTNE